MIAPVVCHLKCITKYSEIMLRNTSNYWVYQNVIFLTGAYVSSTTGNDGNTGLSRREPLATIQKAVDLGFKKILVREGTYTSGIVANGISNVSILLDNYYSTDAANPKIIIDCNNTIANGVNLLNCTDIEFENIKVINATDSGWRISKSQNLTFLSCDVENCPAGMGFELLYSSANFYNCNAKNIGTYGGSNQRDGFNMHGTGTTNFYNCNANYCEDDGISHHDLCQGAIIGGEFHHCGKGGVASPCHGSTVDIEGIYSHDNGYGIYAHCDTESKATTFKANNCVCKNNTANDISVKNNTGIFWNCIYDTIAHSGTVGENIIFGSN